MNGKFFITVLVGVTLPSLSLQTLVRDCGSSTYRRDDVIVASELSENIYAATRNNGVTTTDEFQAYTAQMRNFFQDAAATGVGINVGVVYFSNINNFQYNIQLSAASAVLAGNIPSPTPATGARLIDGLNGILNNVDQIANVGRRVQLPVIYASQISRRDVDPISSIVSQLSQRNVHVYLFAVGSAVTGGNLDNLRNSLRAETGRDVVFTVPNLSNLGQAITTQVLVCDLVITDPACSNCIIEEGTALIRHERCDRYIQCYIQGNRILSTVVLCPHNTLYDETLATCGHANTVLNDRRTKTKCTWCANNVERYQYRDSCASFWQCGGTTGATTLEAKCCPPGQSFQLASGTCISDSGCDRTTKYAHASYCKTYFQCNGEELKEDCCTGASGFVSNDTFSDCTPRADCVDQNCRAPRVNPTCNYEAVGPCHFRRLSADANYATQPCPGGLGFSVDTCTCSIFLDSTTVCTEPKTIDNGCKENFLTTMATYEVGTPNFDDEDEHWPWSIKNNNVSVIENQIGGVYDGISSYLTTKRTAGNGLTRNGMWARVVYQDGTENNNAPLSGPLVLLSNAPCVGAPDANEGASISITTTPVNGRVTVRLLTNSGTERDYGDDVPVEVALNYNTNTYGPNDKKTVTFVYDNNVLSANLFIRGVKIAEEQSQGNSAIAIRSCGVKIGKGAEGQKLFKGTMERVEMHFDCDDYSSL